MSKKHTVNKAHRRIQDDDVCWYNKDSYEKEAFKLVSSVHLARMRDLERQQQLSQRAQTLAQVGLVGGRHDGSRTGQPVDCAGPRQTLCLVSLQCQCKPLVLAWDYISASSIN